MPSTYVITDGTLRADDEAWSAGMNRVLELIVGCVGCGVDYVQIREKHLPAHQLYRLTCAAVDVARNTDTRILVNDRADIACAADADGVHLTTQSIPTRIVRQVFGKQFIIGVSTHTLSEAMQAQAEHADFVTYGAIYRTASKAHLNYPPVGLQNLAELTRTVAPLPVFALGGITTLDRAQACLAHGAHGIAAISFFNNPETLAARVQAINGG